MRTEPTTSDQAVTFPRKVRVSAWVAPIMVVGTFAFFAAIPVAMVVYGVLRRVRTGALRWWAIALGVVYVIPMATWLLKPNRPPSLSKDISPVFVALIVVASAGVIYTLRAHASRAEHAAEIGESTTTLDV